MATQPQGNLGRPRFGPSDSLAAMFRACPRDPTEAISRRLRSMQHTFIQHHRDNAGNANSVTNELAATCCCEAEVWYYRVLEGIISQEKKKLGINHILGILEHELIQRSLVVCCLEIAIFSHRLPGGFPLLLHIFNLPPYDFHKVIVLVVRADEGPPPAVVRHLCQVEEQVLESLAWTRDSPLWHSITANQGHLPTCQQVMRPTHFEDPNNPDRNTHGNRTSGNPPGGVSSSPMTVLDLYSTPSAGSHMTLDRSRAGPARRGPAPSVFLPGQTVVTIAAATVSTNSGQQLTIPVQLCLNVVAGLSTSAEQHHSPSAVNRPQRTSSLVLFMRKVYLLMSRRLSHLCSKLGISDELRLKIWTCFEHSLVNCTNLMLDRHLDQLLMCAIYIMAKITKVDMPFKRIMKCYKSQPQTSNSVCKNVLMSGGETENYLAGNNNNGEHRGSFPTPNTPSTHYPGPQQEERGNLIYFYNQVYTKQMDHFALRFSPTSQATLGEETPPLSPYPKEWKGSPRRHRPSSSHSLYVSPYPSSTPPRTPGLCYYFSSSPSTRLREINNMIKTGKSPNKRGCAGPLEDEQGGAGREGDNAPPVKRLRQDGQSAWQRRLRNVVNDRAQSRTQDQDRPPPVTKPDLH
ncbi:retinoblastoma-like protein 2 [Centroberyx gerrardi]